MLLKCLSGIIFSLFVFSISNTPQLRAQELAGHSTDASILAVMAKNALGKPYVAGTLDSFQTEHLVYHHDRFDCVTLLEWSLAHSLLVQDMHCESNTFESLLRKIRYRDGIIDGYSSRLHYFSSWIENNIGNGYIYEITRDLGGQPYQKELNFMSMNKHLYIGLSDQCAIEEITNIEKALSAADFFMIPKKKIHSIQGLLQTGDIVAFTSHKKGLDISHVGIIVHKDGKPHLLHASSEAAKVVISSESLEKYALKTQGISGIRVCRISE